MGAVAGLLQVEDGAAGDDLHLELDVLLQHLLKGQHTGHTVYQRQHNGAEGYLHLGVGVQVVEHHLGHGVALKLDDHAHTLHRGVVHHVGDTVDALFIRQFHNGLDQILLIDHIGDLGDDDAVAVALLLDLGAGADGDTAAAGGIGGTDARTAHYHTAGGEIGALDVLHQVDKLRLGVVDEHTDAVDDLAQVVGRDIGGHTDRDTAGAVHQQVGESAGQHHGLFGGVIEVGGVVHRILFDVRQHIQAHLAHTSLGITIGGGGVAVDGTEVTVTVDQRIAQREILRHTHQRVVDGGVTVGVIVTQHVTDGGGALTVCLIGGKAVLVHGVEDAAVHRL